MTELAHAGWPGIIEAYRDRLPVTDRTPVVTLNEGNTPLVEAPRLSEQVGARVLLKVEGANPTGSFKDRGMTVAISKAAEDGAKVVVCASTGNTSASAAAYAARAGMIAAVIIPDGHVALGKLAQALIHGAKVVPVRGSFDDALHIVRQLGERGGVTVVNSINPFRIEGQKTAAFEICDALGNAPHVHCIPVGNAGNITAYWKGYTEYEHDQRSTRSPRMLGWQAAGSAPLVLGEPVLHPETIATAIRIGNPASWDSAIAARDESGGAIGSVTDAQILDAYRLLASLEGVFVEPASAASVAGLLQGAAQGLVERDEVVVCTVTGHGLKDPNRAISEIEPKPPVDANVEQVLAELGLWLTMRNRRAYAALAGALALAIAGGAGFVAATRDDSAQALAPPTTTTASTTSTTTTVARSTTTTLALPHPTPPPADPYANVPVNQIGTILIPKIGLAHPIFEGVWLTVVDHGPGHWPGSAEPGHIGNAVFAGHRVTHTHPFLNLDLLAPGDRVVFDMPNGVFTYAVMSITIVLPTDIGITDPTRTPTITLFACNPKHSAAQRIVVKGKLISSRRKVPAPKGTIS